MRPIGKVGTQGETEEPFREISDARRYECDNCGHVLFHAKNTEYVVASDSVIASVEKTDKKEP
jgi:hypothetical protein